jgi:uncharacterized membrane protein (DUF106 family)
MEAAISWQVVLALVVILGLIVTVVKPILKLNTTLTTLDLTIKSLQEQLKSFRGNNDKDHDEIFERLDEHEDTLIEHDKAITELKMKQ